MRTGNISLPAASRLAVSVLPLNIEENKIFFLGTKGVFVRYLGTSSMLTALRYFAPVRYVDADRTSPCLQYYAAMYLWIDI